LGAGRVVGGIIALIGGALILIHCIIATNLLTDFGTNYAIAWIINLLVALLAIIGGILGLASKSGGIPALIAGLIALLLPILAYVIGDLNIAQMFSQLSGIYYYTGFFLFTLPSPMSMIVSIESLIILVGGIIMLASSSE
jgi:hypothetical protein